MRERYRASMRTVEEIKADYAKAKENTEMAPVKGYTRVYGYANQDLRDELRREYIQTLPKNKQLAIYLHSKLCHCNHTDMCGFYYGVKELEDDWTEYSHADYLKKADNAIKNVMGETGMDADHAADVVKASVQAL